jgi:hypothetical protein
LGALCLNSQTFTLISQNCLHLGWSVAKYPQKSPTFQANAALAQVTVFQEVMDLSVAGGVHQRRLLELA